MTNNFTVHRPSSSRNRGDRQLPRLITDLTALLADTQEKLIYDTLWLPDSDLADLAHALVEFAEDLHNDIGLWRSLEQYNLEFFETPLPLILPAGAGPPSLEERLHHLLWNLYQEIDPDLVLGPDHRDLRRLAAVAADFLDRRMAKVPRRSGVKTFLAQPNRFGWDVKRKLIWLGQHSYLFRHHFENYMAAQSQPLDIDNVDDFICQHTTAWSGLGVVDILAAALPLKEAQRAELRSWYERHRSFYRVAAARGPRLKLINLVTEQPYNVRMDPRDNVFRGKQIIFGALTPWRGEWYWSGAQRLYNDVPETKIPFLIKQLKETASQVVYRYDKALLKQAQESAVWQQQLFLAHFGDDLVVFSDGLSMAAAMQRMYRLFNETIPEEKRSSLMEEYGLDSAAPNMPYPRQVIDNENGVAVLFEPNEGTQIMIGFNDVTGGLEKRGGALTEDEESAVRAFIEAKAISPQFVHRVVREYGLESIPAAFLISSSNPQTAVDYLLRRYKGHFYRRRYPQVTLVKSS